ncbi:MAG: glycosyltransferase [Bacilli bacterium]|nr:glycosyltransferase [Bacilli bacterium]
MSKIFIAANTLDIGGIETSLIAFLKNIDLKKNKVTLLLQNRKGALLEQVPKGIDIIEYKPIKSKNILFRKIKNRINFINFIKENKDKYDVSICYASYIYLPSIIVRKISKNNYMWVHTDYSKIYSLSDFFRFIKLYGYNKYSNLVFVSKEALNNYPFKMKEQKYFVCHNLLPLDIEKKSLEKVDYKKKKKFLFVNISRHDEDAKKISRIIEASYELKKEYSDFEVLLIGEGNDTSKYVEMLNNYEINDTIKILPMTTNPYPYYKLADCFLLSSNYEGGPITIYESLILKTPVITTNVGDVKDYVDKNNGIIIDKNVMSLKRAMFEFINNKYSVKFDSDKFNKEVKDVLNSIIESGNNHEI